MPVLESEKLEVAVIDDEDDARAFVESTIGDVEHIDFVEFADPDEFLRADISKIDIFIVDKVFGGETRVQDLILKIRKESQSEIIVLSNDPSSDIFDERVIRLLKGRVYLGPSELRTAVLSILHGQGNVFQSAIDAIQRLDAAELSGQTTINEIRLESIAYPLREATAVVWTENSYSVAGLFEHITGRGETASSAMKDFVRNFHDVFSRLNKCLSKGETLQGQDRKTWSAIKKVVDIEGYEKARTIVVPFEIGQVSLTEQKGLISIHWKTRETTDTIEVERVPTLALLNDGDWISAIVRRRTDETLHSVLHTHWIEAPEFAQDEIDEFWNQRG